MSGSLNKVTLIGRLGRDPEMRSTNDGKEIANFNLATTESWKDKFTNEKKEKTEWHKVVCFNEGLVRVIKEYVKKGTRLYLEGQLQTRKWTDKDNQEKYTTEVVLQGYNTSLILLSSNSNTASVEQGNHQSSTSTADYDDLDDEIPF
jgi:single-strand DNA-binding protein